jgi:hypothetical protein
MIQQPKPKYRPISPVPDPNQCPVCGYTHPLASLIQDHRRKENHDE